MLMKMRSEMPFPIPRSVICSPSHITKMVPEVWVSMVSRRNPIPGLGTTAVTPSAPRSPSRNRQNPKDCTTAKKTVAVARDLGDLLPPFLALLAQLLEVRDHRTEELQDDRGIDVRHDAEGEDSRLRQRPAREEVIETEQRPGLSLEERRESRAVDPRRRHVAAEAIDDEKRGREQDPLLQLWDPEHALEALDQRHLIRFSAER